ERPDQVLGLERESDERILRAVEPTDAGPLKDEEPVVGEELVDLLEVHVDVLDADVLDHLEADDLVETALDVSVVADLDLRFVLDAVVLDALRAVVDLLLGERDSADLCAALFRRARDERSPAAADVEEALALLQLQLVTATIDLRVLRILERGLG